MTSLRCLLCLLRPGDYVVLAMGLALVAALFVRAGNGTPGQTLVVRAKGQVVAELPLNTTHTLQIAGAAGNTVIEIIKGRARVAVDPGPRQLCVKQGWISHAGEALLCLANQVTLEIPGGAAGFDSLNY